MTIGPPLRTSDRIERRYFLWLCDVVYVSRTKYDVGNMNLCSWLHTKQFTGGIPNDDNRAEDGKKLRGEFLEQSLVRELPSDKPCSVLEMLVALALRMDYIVSRAPDDHLVGKYFWEFIDNLGLDISNTHSDIENTEILRTFLGREYSYNGSGGLFPLRNPKKDQRKVEIWYQMMAYIEENYP